MWRRIGTRTTARSAETRGVIATSIPPKIRAGNHRSRESAGLFGETILTRLARTRSAHPRLSFDRPKAWMAGSSPAKTNLERRLRSLRRRKIFPGQLRAKTQIQVRQVSGVSHGLPLSR